MSKQENSSSGKSKEPLFYRVAVPSPLRRTFDYLPAGEDTAAVGSRVRIPFGTRKLTGVVVAHASESDVPAAKLRPIEAALDREPLFSAPLITLLLWAADYYQTPVGEVFAAALPARLRAGEGLTSSQERWTSTLLGQHRDQYDKAAASLSRAPRQLALLDLLLEHGSLDPRAVTEAGFGRPQLRALQERGFAQCSSETPPARAHFSQGYSPAANSGTAFELNAEQHTAVAALNAEPESFRCFLLDGVTGSGKTEVYMQAMAHQLALGRQCLVLVPEIGLTPQTISRFRQRFSCPVVVLHSALNETERLSAWTQARDGSAGVVIGTRSALFTPLATPGILILDEEHDASFKQQDGFRYSARDLAAMRGRAENMPVVLGSATPSLETLHNALAGKFIHLKLPHSTAAQPRAVVELVDIESAPLREGFSEQSLQRLRLHLERGNQCLVFINRRGYAPVLNCSSCGWQSECEDCSAKMTVHRSPPRLRCHHCGMSVALPRSCPHCQSTTLDTLGLGTQKVETFLSQEFADFPVIRVDRDSTRGKSAMDSVIARVDAGEPCILLGTQMLAKGHHFPNMTLVVILDADGGLFSADFRGQEHMAQLVTQVAGRAGRADKPGEVLLQTKHAAHATLQALSNESYAQYSARQLGERLEANLPPFAHLALLKIEASEFTSALHFGETAASISVQLAQDPRLAIELQGPLPAPMEKRAGRFRVHLLLKSARRGQLQDHLSYLVANLEQAKTPARLRWSIDVDPQDMI